MTSQLEEKKMKLTWVLPLASLLIADQCIAGTWSPRQEAIWNFASGAAFFTQCAARGYARIEPVTKLLEVYEQRLTSDAYADWREIFQRTMHEKQLYSIAYDQWIPYVINAEGCKGTDQAAEMLALRFSPPDQ